VDGTVLLINPEVAIALVTGIEQAGDG
jgi:hypothetical protein